MGRAGMDPRASGLRWRRQSGHRGIQSQQWALVDTALIGWREHLGGLGWSASGYSAELKTRLRPMFFWLRPLEIPRDFQSSVPHSESEAQLVISQSKDSCFLKMHDSAQR